MKRDPHISDEELILALDGELEERCAGAVEEHLAHCWTCRSRRGDLERAIAEFVQLRHASPALTIAAGEGPAARLHATLAREPAGAGGGGFRLSPLAVGCAAAIAVSTIAAMWLSGQRASAGPLPDSRLTPGATRLISREQVCVVPAEDDNRAIPADLATRVFLEYRIDKPKPRSYEVDYLISPTLGGADDIRNLWPQPYAEGVWTSRVKDALEDHLRRLVCEGRLDLATAQHEIALDWISAYRKYFQTDRPLAAHAIFVKDRPWE